MSSFPEPTTDSEHVDCLEEYNDETQSWTWADRIESWRSDISISSCWLRKPSIGCMRWSRSMETHECPTCGR